MRTAKSKVGAALGLAALVVSAGVATSQATAGADPAGHTVRYTLTSGAPYDFQLSYLTAQPPSKAAFNTDSSAFMKRETINVGPNTPWVFETTLADPQWGFLQVSSVTHGGVGAPNAHCEIAIDGQVAVQQDHPYSPMCLLSQW
jgi:hypothetical protein